MQIDPLMKVDGDERQRHAGDRVQKNIFCILPTQKFDHAHASVVMVRRDSGGVGHPRNGERSAGASDCNAALPRRCSSCKFARFPTSKSICTRAGIPVFGDETVGNHRHTTITTITAVLPRR